MLRSKFVLCLTIFSIVIFLQYQQGHCMHYPSYFQSYPYIKCMGQPETIFESNSDIPGSGNVKLQHGKSIGGRGIWRYETAWGLAGVQIYDKGGFPPCSTYWAHRGDDMDLLYAENLVPFDLDENVVAIFPLPTFNGVPVFINITDKPISFATPLHNMASWAIFGGRSVTLYENTDYSGKMTCILVQEEGVWGINVANRSVTVGSLQPWVDTSKCFDWPPATREDEDFRRKLQHGVVERRY